MHSFSEGFQYRSANQEKLRAGKWGLDAEPDPGYTWQVADKIKFTVLEGKGSQMPSRIIELSDSSAAGTIGKSIAYGAPQQLSDWMRNEYYLHDDGKAITIRMEMKSEFSSA